MPNRRNRSQSTRSATTSFGGHSTGRPTGAAQNAIHNVRPAQPLLRSRPPVRNAPRSTRTSPRSGPSLHYVTLLAVVLVLMLTGVVMVLSASPIVGINHGGEPLLYFRRHLYSVGLAVIVLLVTLGIDYQFWRRLAIPIVAVSMMLLVAVLLVGDTVYGSKRWLDFGFFHVQPSEIAKLAVVIAVAAFLERHYHELAVSHRSLRPLLLVLGGGCALVLLQPDLGTTLILVAIAAGMIFAVGVPSRYLLRLGLYAVPVIAILFVSAGYRRSRLIGFLNPTEERLGAGYQAFQNLVGLAQGGVTGSGLGAGQAKWGWVPNAHTDFIFVIIGEEMGFLGGVMVLALLTLLGVLGFGTARRVPDIFGSLMASGITIWFMLQTFVNIGGALGVLPISGVTLPFLSYGSSSLLVNSAAAGMLLSIAKNST